MCAKWQVRNDNLQCLNILYKGDGQAFAAFGAEFVSVGCVGLRERRCWYVTCASVVVNRLHFGASQNNILHWQGNAMRIVVAGIDFLFPTYVDNRHPHSGDLWA